MDAGATRLVPLAGAVSETVGAFAATTVTVTAAEVVAAQLLPSIGMTSLVAPSLLIMAVVKGALIILYYMHLKSDSGVYAAPMVFGLVLATGMLLTMIGLWALNPRVPCTPELGKACVVEK